jgi:phage/plasmid-like protein (TIGR03299 family)
MPTLMSSSENERVVMTATSQRVPQWRKIGKPVGNAMTAQEALKIGGLDFNVSISPDPVSTVVDGKTLTVQNKFITYADTGKELRALGVVGNRYTPIQNSEAFDLLNNIVDESGANYDSAGMTGSKCWIMMKMPGTIKVGNNTDAIDTYLRCSNSHDGSSSFRIETTFLRLICTNGLTGMVSGSSITLRHTQSATLKVQEAREALQIVFQQQESFELEVQRLLNTKMTDGDYKKFVEVLVPEAKDETSTRKQNSVERVRGELFGLWRADTQAIVKNTAWAAYNAVAEYVDWYKPVRGSGEDKDVVRAERRLSGNSSLKNRAYELLSV